jgi:hypothetical protein
MKRNALFGVFLLIATIISGCQYPPEYELASPAHEPITDEAIDLFQNDPDSMSAESMYLEQVLSGYVETIDVYNYDPEVASAINSESAPIRNKRDALRFFIEYADRFGFISQTEEDIDCCAYGKDGAVSYWEKPAMGSGYDNGKQTYIIVDKDGLITRLFDTYEVYIEPGATVSQKAAEEAAIEATIEAYANIGVAIDRSHLEIEGASELDYDNSDDDAGGRLAWHVNIFTVFPYMAEGLYNRNTELYPLISMSYHIYANGENAGAVYRSASNRYDSPEKEGLGIAKAIEDPLRNEPDSKPINPAHLVRLASGGYITVFRNSYDAIVGIQGDFTPIMVSDKYAALLVFNQIAPMLGYNTLTINDIEKIMMYGEGGYQSYWAFPTPAGVAVDDVVDTERFRIIADIDGRVLAFWIETF